MSGGAALVGLMLGLVAAAPKPIPKVKDPCLQQCEEAFKRSTRSCHAQACFKEQSDHFRDCGAACGQKKSAQERTPECMDPHGKKVKCSALRDKRARQGP